MSQPGRYRIGALLVAGITVASCTSSDGTATTTTPDPTTQLPISTTTSTTEPSPADAVGFGRLESVDLLSDDAPYAGPTHPDTLDDVIVADWIAQSLDANDAADTLTGNGFVVVPSRTRLFHQAYEGAAYEGHPVFVTTDVAYHVWHLAFDKVLRETEERALLPALESMLTASVDRARAQEAEMSETPLAEAAGRVTQFYEAAATLLELDVGPIGPLAEAEVELALAAEDLAVSPTIGIDDGSEFSTRKTDYSLFRPRGHYTRNADLERYFRAMSQLGNNAFLLEPESLLMGVLASRIVADDPSVWQQWRAVYEPTAFLVGAADDYTPSELGTAVSEVVPNGWDDLERLRDPAALQQIATALAAARPVLINPEAASVRVMGARLVVDSYVLDQLVEPNVSGRFAASTLDLAAAFGSEWAYSQLEATGETDYPGYDEQLASARDLLDGRTIDDWGRTVYDSWLYAIDPTWRPHGVAFPAFMQTPAWTAKAHQTGFGSYTELKHDTILYTKQAVAEGGGDEPPIPPRHWVEPDPVVFARLAAVTTLLREGLSSRGLLTAEYDTLLVDFAEFSSWLAGLAADELADRPIGQADNDRLESVGSILEGFWIRTSDADRDLDDGPDSFSALVADVMRNDADILELGTGFVDTIFVLVPNDGGAFQVAVGGVYSFYEFWSPQRLTDEEWRDRLGQDPLPIRPTWQEVFLADGPPVSAGLEPGLFCRDLVDRGLGFGAALEYWRSEGLPERMDADRNGVPCETVYAADEIEAVLEAAGG